MEGALAGAAPSPVVFRGSPFPWLGVGTARPSLSSLLFPCSRLLNTHTPTSRLAALLLAFLLTLASPGHARPRPQVCTPAERAVSVACTHITLTTHPHIPSHIHPNCCIDHGAVQPSSAVHRPTRLSALFDGSSSSSLFLGTQKVCHKHTLHKQMTRSWNLTTAEGSDF